MLLAAAGLVSPGLVAHDTAFDSLAFVPERGPGPEVKLPEHPTLNWTRVVFNPQRTNGFPEELTPLRVLVSPLGQVSALAADGDDLWVAVSNQVCQLDARSGAVHASFASPAEDAAGLARDGRVLWLADRKGRCVFGLNDKGQVLHRFELTFDPSAFLRIPGELLVSDWAKAEFHRLDSQTGRDLGTEPSPDTQLTGLTRAGGRLWCSRGGEIVCFDRERSLPVCGFSAAYAGSGPLTVSGLASDGESLWYGNKATNCIVQIRLPSHGEWVAGAGRIRRAGFEMGYRNTSDQAVDSFCVLQHVPFLEMPGHRYLELEVQPQPRAYFRDDLGNVIALLNFGRLGPNDRVRCQIMTTMWVADRRLVVDPGLIAGAAGSSEQRAYTQRFHPIAGEESAEVKGFVEQAVKGETNLYWRVRKVHDALCRALVYREPAQESVPGVLAQGYGVCRNYSAAMETFGRRLGVPVLNAWAPRHETCFLMLPGVGPAIVEVTANDSGRDPATAWRRSRWFLGTSADEITTGVRGFAMHTPLLLEGVSYAYRWHYWTVATLQGIRHDGWWTVTDPATGKVRRL